ncbi:hypothetical protein STEG23_019107 [Scotinomys teguina]
MAFIWQSAPDIRDKLQRLENLQNYILQDLLKEAEKIYNKRETPEEKEERLRKLQEERDDKILKGIAEKQRESDCKRGREISRILATVTQTSQRTRQEKAGKSDRRGDFRRPRVDHDQCAYCKEKGHWVRNCPRRPKRKPEPPSHLLTLDED